MENNPFTEQEKRFVLAEAIKASNIPLDRIYDFYRRESNYLEPLWFQIAVPPGRNVQGCLEAFKSLEPSQVPAFPPNLPSPSIPLFTSSTTGKRRSTNDLETTTEPKKRRGPGPENISTARSIQPRPPNGSPTAFSPTVLGQPSSTSTSTSGKKRGRPSKKDLEIRQAEAIARGEIITPIKAAGPETAKLPVHEDFKAFVPIAPMMPTTSMQAEAELMDSGKKKRAGRGLKTPKAQKPGEGSFSMYQPPASNLAPQEQQAAPASPSFVRPDLSIEQPVQGEGTVGTGIGGAVEGPTYQGAATEREAQLEAQQQVLQTGAEVEVQEPPQRSDI